MQMLKKRSSMKKGHDNYLCPYPLITMGQKTFSFTAEGIVQSDNLQYNTLGCWIDCLIDQTSDGPSIILID